MATPIIGVQLPLGIQCTNATPVDTWSGPYEGTTLTDAVNLANASIPHGVRFRSMEVRLVVSGVAYKYWYKNGVDDVNLELFSSGGGGGGTGIFDTSGTEAKTTYSAAFSGQEGVYPSGKGSDVFFYVSGSFENDKKSVFGGDTYVSGSFSAALGMAFGFASIALGPAFTFGSGSFAQGKECAAVGSWSHDEGLGSQTIAAYSHAEGRACMTGGPVYAFTVPAGGTALTIPGDATRLLNGSTPPFFPTLQVSVPGPGALPSRTRNVYLSAFTYDSGLNITTITLSQSIDGSSTHGFIFNEDIGNFSHAEGYTTTATGIAAHSEGKETSAVGDFSHAEGMGTVASGSAQHVSGMYNLQGNTKSIFVIGNGTNDSNRSDVLRIDGANFQVTGSLSVKGPLNVAAGTNMPAGTVTLDGASPNSSANVSNTLIKANSIIILTKQTFSTPAGVVGVYSTTPGSGFTIHSSTSSDTDTVGYLIINP